MVWTMRSLWRVALAMLFAAALGVSLSSASAGAATGSAPLQITVTDGGYAVRPDVAAGRYEITIENLSGQPVDVILVRIPEGWSATDVQTALATGISALVSGPVEQSVLESAQSPYVVYAGQAAPHSQGKAVVDLVPGSWVVMSGQAGVGSDAAEFTVGSAG